MSDTEYVICTDCMDGGCVETEEATTDGLTLRDYECDECGATGREWIWSHSTEWKAREGSIVRHVDLSASEWAEARGTWGEA